MAVPGCLSEEQCIFCICYVCQLGRERIVPYGVGGPSLFLRVLVHTCMGEARLSGHNLDGDAGHCLKVCGWPSLT